MLFIQFGQLLQESSSDHENQNQSANESLSSFLETLNICVSDLSLCFSVLNNRALTIDYLFSCKLSEMN